MQINHSQEPLVTLYLRYLKESHILPRTISLNFSFPMVGGERHKKNFLSVQLKRDTFKSRINNTMLNYVGMCVHVGEYFCINLPKAVFEKTSF